METAKFSRQLCWISYLLKTQIKYLRRIIHNKEKYYNTFQIKKKKGLRKIESPNPSLSRIQKLILKKILIKKYPVSYHAHAYVKDRSIVTNAQSHINKKLVLKIDIKDFFPSINYKRVYLLFRENFNIQVSEYLAEICTYKDHLPQGAPTSPYISNLICRNLDKRIDCLLCKDKNKIIYTRYADDLIFSGNKIKRSLFNQIKNIIKEEGFELNKRKETWNTQRNCQRITGIIVNNKISYGRKNFKDLAAMVHNCSKGKLLQEIEKAKSKGLRFHDLKNYLYGKVAFLKSIDENKANKLKDKLDSITWNEYSAINEQNKKRELHTELMKILNSINRKFPSRNFLTERYELPISLISQTKSETQFNEFCLHFSNVFHSMKPSQIENSLLDDKPLEQLNKWLNRKKREGNRILSPIRDVIGLANHLERHPLGSKPAKQRAKIFKKYGQKISNPQFEQFKNDLVSRIIMSLEELDHVLKEDL